MKRYKWQKRTRIDSTKAQVRDLRKYGSMYFDPFGRCIDIMRFGHLMQYVNWRRLCRTFTHDSEHRHVVITIWNGIDMALGFPFGRPLPPMIFETLVFCDGPEINATRLRNRARTLRAGREHLQGLPFDVTQFGEEYEEPPLCELDSESKRYHSRKYALKAHNRMVEAVRRFEKEKRNGATGSTDMSLHESETAHGS